MAKIQKKNKKKLVGNTCIAVCISFHRDGQYLKPSKKCVNVRLFLSFEEILYLVVLITKIVHLICNNIGYARVEKNFLAAVSMKVSMNCTANF